MRLHRFFIEESLRNKKEVSLFDDAVTHQLKDVFRMHAGDKLILLDNSGYEYLSEISLISKSKVDVKILDSSISENLPEKQKELWLFAALIKKDNYEWILEKCTEVGVSHFVPIISDRSEKKDLNKERAEKIIKEAAEQSGRGMMPVLHDVVSLEEALTQAQEQNIYLIAFHTDSDSNSENTLEKFDPKMIQEKNQEQFQNTQHKLGILVGPEGGWSDREINLFKEKNISLYTLGKQVLRAETAAVAISSLILFK